MMTTVTSQQRVGYVTCRTAKTTTECNDASYVSWHLFTFILRIPFASGVSYVFFVFMRKIKDFIKKRARPLIKKVNGGLSAAQQNNDNNSMRKHLIWAEVVLLLGAMIVVGAIVASGGNGSSEQAITDDKASPTDPPTPTEQPTTPATIATVSSVVKLTASDAVANDEFGSSMAMDGDTWVIGAQEGTVSGSVYVFVRSGITDWTEQAKLTSGTTKDRYGGDGVAIHGDVIVVGASEDYAGNTGDNMGSAYVYARSGSSWTEQAKLAASDGTDTDMFGNSVAVHGETVVVGAHWDDGGGSVYIYIRSGTTWTQQARLPASDGDAGDAFGSSVSIYGNTLVIGDWVDDAHGESSGSAYIFDRSGTGWTEQAKLFGSETQAYDNFGISLAIEGDTIIIGTDSETNGSAYIFDRTETSWSEQSKQTASAGASNDSFGWSVAIHGNMVVMGADWDDDNGEQSGSAYIYGLLGGSWTEQAKLTANDGSAGDIFGWSVAMEENTVVVGSVWDSDSGEHSGSAYVFNLN